jgi:hypothetical protein
MLHSKPAKYRRCGRAEGRNLSKKRSLTEPQGIELDIVTYVGLEGNAELSSSMLPESAVSVTLLSNSKRDER